MTRDPRVSHASPFTFHDEHRKFTGHDRARELKPFFDKHDLRGFDDWRHRLHEGLAKSRLFDQRVQDVKRAAESATTVPLYNKEFSGRLDGLLALRDRLKDDRAGVISGVHSLGGIGKTELAFTYAHAFASAYPGGRFLGAGNAVGDVVILLPISSRRL